MNCLATTGPLADAVERATGKPVVLARRALAEAVGRGAGVTGLAKRCCGAGGDSRVGWSELGAATRSLDRSSRRWSRPATGAGFL